MSFIFFAWIASFSYCFETILGKLFSKHSLKNPWFYNFIWSLFILLFTIPIALQNHVVMPQKWGDLILASLFTSLSYIFYVLALYKLDVSVLTPLFNLRSIFTVLFGVLLLGEILTGKQYLLIFVIILAGFFSSLNDKFNPKSFFNSSVGLVIIDVISLSLMSIYLNKAVAQNGYWTVALWSILLAQIFMLVTVPLFIKDVKKTTFKQYGVLALISLAGVIGQLTSLKAFSSNVSITTVILSMPISLVVAFIFSKTAPQLLEKHTSKVYIIRLIAVAIMIIAGLNL